jgi:PAS domain S-box-containing protein
MLWVILAGFLREKKRLEESEGLYRELLTRQGEGFAMLDAEERFRFANPVAEAIFGVPTGQLAGRSLLESLTPDQQELIHRETTRRREGNHSTYELTIRREDGASRTLLVTATPRPSKDDEPLQVIGVFRDITERKETEDRLIQSEEKFRAFVEQSFDVIFTLNAQGLFTFVSPAWMRHFGYPVNDVVGQPFASFVHEEDIQPCFDYLVRMLATGQNETSPPYRVRRLDGTWRWFLANGGRIITPEGEPQFMGVGHDITDSKLAEEALKASEERYRAQFDRASEGIFTLSPEGKILEVNESMARMHGYTIAEMLALSLKEVDTPASTREAGGRMARLLAGEALTIEVEHYHKDGHTFPLEVSASLVSIGGKQAILCFHRDITDRKQAEETNRLLAQEKSHTQKMDSLGGLAGGVAHDFNNMLGGVMGYADLLLSGEEDPKRQKYLRSIIAAASRSAELTQKLLAFGRRGKNLVESLRLRPVVEDCLGLLRPTMSPDLQVILALEECPPVDADPSQIHQVVLNLCLNAIEAMPERGTLTVRTHSLELEEGGAPGAALAPGSYVELRVTDTGLGMTEEVRQRVFEPFFTTKNTSGMSGTGLGLSTTFGIVHAHHGSITVESTRGKGTTFRVLLPKGVLPETKDQTQPVPVMGEGVVLLVEDEPILRELGTTVLETLGFEVIEAADGVAAIAAYREHHQRLCAVLLDLKMPRMGGRETFLELQNINPGVPVVVCTGYGENEEVQDLLTRGAAGMLAKPYQIATMAAKLKQVAVIPLKGTV